MLSDRSYMRDTYPDRKVSVLTWLISATIAAFVLENVLLRMVSPGSFGALLNGMALSIAGLRAGHVWTLATYSLLHSPDNLLHIVCNLLGLYFLGRPLLPLLGEKRFLGFYAAAVVVGGLAWTAVNWRLGGSVIGASAAVMGLLILFACFFPDQEITFLLFFILPVRVKPKYLAFAAAGFDLFGCVFYEVLGKVSPFGPIAYSAHLGAMGAAWLYYRFVHSPSAFRPVKAGRSGVELPAWMKRSAAAVAKPAFQVNVENRADLRAEVDRILDKINSQGFGALTADEKRRLDEARDLLSRR